MKLIVGLGNPGKEYMATRHNIGYMFIDEVVKKIGLTFLIDKQKKCFICQTNIQNEKIIFIKPITYMNLSGEAVQNVANFYKIDYSDILVIYDDLDLPLGQIRIRPHGSSGGHNGIKNIIAHLNTEEIKRVRIGISKVNKNKTVDYVLGSFNKEEQEIINISLAKAYNIIMDYLTLPFEQIMSRYNNEKNN